MARRIIEDGFPTTLWARRRESLDPYAETQAVFAADRRALGAASDVLCLCVIGDTDIDEVLRGEDGALAEMAPGGIVVIHSTVHPDTCRRLQSDFAHLHVVDAPVSGGGHLAAAKALLVMVGGDDDAVNRCRPVLETFANPLVHLGALGAGLAAKLLNNALFSAHLGLAAEIFSVVDELGVDKDALAAVLASGSGRSYALQVIAGSGHTLSVIAELAGPLLKKDVDILADLIGHRRSDVLEVAHKTTMAMNLATR
jgi:3-hydroxyisobutyrate dehydrogenase